MRIETAAAAIIIGGLLGGCGSSGGANGQDGGTLDAELAPLGLTATERADPVAFLGTLDGEAVPAALLVDTSL